MKTFAKVAGAVLVAAMVACLVVGGATGSITLIVIGGAPIMLAISVMIIGSLVALSI